VALVEALSIAAGIAIENARLHARVRRSAVFEDRDRMARDLHDTVIQQLFALGLSLQSLSGRVPETSAGQLRSAVEQIDRVIAQVRSTIYELGSGDESRGVRDDVDALVHQLGAVVGFDVELTVVGPVDTAVPSHLGEHLLAAIREALAYVGTHAEATRASVDVTVAGQACRLTVTFDAAVPESDEGGPPLANLRHRAEKLHGSVTLDCPPGGRTTVAWLVPLGT
jgi:signal transduction histidine kinase